MIVVTNDAAEKDGGIERQRQASRCTKQAVELVSPAGTLQKLKIAFLYGADAVYLSGKEWDSDFAMTFTVENGLITYWRPIHDMTAEAEAYQP